MSGDSYSAQLNVRNSVGEPHSHIIHLSSLFLTNEYCFVPRTDCSIVHRFASSCSLFACTLLKSVPTVIGWLLLDCFNILYTPAESSRIFFATVSKTHPVGLS